MAQLHRFKFSAVRGISNLKRVQILCPVRNIFSSHRRKVENVTAQDISNLDNLQESRARNLDFNNYQMAYKNMTTREIARALFVLKLSSVDYFVDNCLKTMHYSRKILGNRLFDKVAKATFYGQFVGGDNEQTLLKCVNKKREAGIGPMLAVPIEDDAEECSGDIDTKFDRNLEIMLESVDLVERLDDIHPMIQVKLTALVPGLLCAKLSKLVPEPSSQPSVIEHIADVLRDGRKISIKGLPEADTSQLEKGMGRLRTLSKVTTDKEMVILVDAEYTYLNPALNLLSLAMMLNCYRNKPLIYYTYQNYLKSTERTLERDISFIKSRGVGFAAKLVRGAYLEKERYLAKKDGYEDPVHPTFDDTTKTYTNSLNKMLNHVVKDPLKFAVVVATHNEDTTLYAVERMAELGLKPSSGSVFFGQVYGMCDHVSFTLGQNGYLIYKSIPYGTVMDTLPYLSRRALENRSVMDFRRERKLLMDAFKDRLYKSKSTRI